VRASLGVPADVRHEIGERIRCQQYFEDAMAPLDDELPALTSERPMCGVFDAHRSDFGPRNSGNRDVVTGVTGPSIRTPHNLKRNRAEGQLARTRWCAPRIDRAYIRSHGERLVAAI
jgi:hypothetical protein